MTCHWWKQRLWRRHVHWCYYTGSTSPVTVLFFSSPPTPPSFYELQSKRHGAVDFWIASRLSKLKFDTQKATVFHHVDPHFTSTAFHRVLKTLHASVCPSICVFFVCVPVCVCCQKKGGREGGGCRVCVRPMRVCAFCVRLRHRVAAMPRVSLE